MRQTAILNLHLRLWDSNISVSDVRPPFAVEGRRAVEVTHLALARRQNRGDGILGVLQIKSSRRRLLFYALLAVAIFWHRIWPADSYSGIFIEASGGGFCFGRAAHIYKNGSVGTRSFALIGYASAC